MISRLQQVQVSYMAGIIDGEGHIGISRRRKNYHYSWSYDPHVSVTNTSEELLLWLQNSTRFGTITARRTLESRKSCAVWQLRVHEMAPFLRAIQPYLIVKLRQSEILLDYLASIRHNHGRGKGHTEEEITLKENLFYEMSALNERGIP